MPFFTAEEIEKAREMDLLTYLRRCDPGELVKVHGNTYSTREHDSLKISNGKWMWWSRGFGGASALDYLVKVRGDPFTEAVSKILNAEGINPPIFVSTDMKDKQRKLLLPEKSSTNDIAIKYLLKRGIDIEVIDYCTNKGLIYESMPYHNIIFVGFDDTGNPRYASYRGTTGRKVMGEATGSDKRYSFSIDVQGDSIHVFESAIDLLSFATKMKLVKGEWRNYSMFSLGGVYPGSPNKEYTIPVALSSKLERREDIRHIYLHLDNDYAGRKAASGIIKMLGDEYEIWIESPRFGKDVNDDLVNYLDFIEKKGRKEYGR